jgi:hypothetical protein
MFNVRLTLLNAHIPSGDLLQWHAWKSMRAMLGSVLNSFSLIVPQSDAVSEADAKNLLRAAGSIAKRTRIPELFV